MRIPSLNIKHNTGHKIVSGGSDTYTPLLEYTFKYPSDYNKVYNELNEKQKSIVDYFSYLKEDIKIICSDFTNTWTDVIDKSINLIDQNLEENDMREVGIYPGIDSYLSLTKLLKKNSSKRSINHCDCSPDEKLSYTPCSLLLVIILLIISNDEPMFEGNIWMCVLIMVRKWDSRVGSLNENILNYYLNLYDKELSGKFKKEEILTLRRFITTESSIKRYKTLKTKIDEVNKEFTLINDRLLKKFNEDKDRDNYLTNTIGMVTIASLMIMKNSK